MLSFTIWCKRGCHPHELCSCNGGASYCANVPACTGHHYATRIHDSDLLRDHTPVGAGDGYRMVLPMLTSCL